MSKRSNKRKIAVAVAILCSIFSGMHAVAKRTAEGNEIDAENPYIGTGKGRESRDGSAKIYGRPIRSVRIYETYVKPATDRILSFAGFILLAPLLAAISLVIMIDDPGPVIFRQRRVGKAGHFFYLHKFRSMKMCTPRDVPTHQLENPEQYITRVGKFLRKYSLDELPQIWDIFRGRMSIIGPRPALWNQDDLVAERDKYGANDVLPGLTGWAQINGRDELEIADKARLDGEYVKRLKQGGMRALFFDVRCFLGTIGSVAGSRGVVEGGTGGLHRAGKGIGSRGTVEGGSGKLHGAGDKAETAADGGVERRAGTAVRLQPSGKQEIQQQQTESIKQKNTGTLEENAQKLRKKTGMRETADRVEAEFEDYGYLKHFDIDTSENNKKRVLITGAGSYIGESFERWAKKHYPINFTIDTVDMRKSGWRQKDFSGYDAVFHVAGIAHADVGKVSEEEKKKYYAVNTGLAIETAKKAKTEGVKQFVLMSSMIIYGDSAPYGKERVIDETTPPAPANFYGDSKWQADKGVRKLADRGERALTDGAFRVAVLRPPMIYGKGSKGNYPVLAKLAKALPVFPDVENCRSMLYIDNLCEFLCKLMLSGEGGIYFPQNGEYTKTSDLVKNIADATGHKIVLSKAFNWAIGLSSIIPGEISGLANKVFGNLAYDQKISVYDFKYQRFSLADSIGRTEADKQRVTTISRSKNHENNMDHRSLFL